jgi:hypothetical protein
VGYHLIVDKHNGVIPEDLKTLKDKLRLYQEQLSKWGLKDYQVTNLEQEMSITKIITTLGHALGVLLLASIPSLILNAPVGFAASYWAKIQAAKDLKVLTTHKFTISLTTYPVLLCTCHITVSRYYYSHHPPTKTQRCYVQV